MRSDTADNELKDEALLESLHGVFAPGREACLLQDPEIELLCPQTDKTHGRTPFTWVMPAT
jgi:hypothetical protein